MAIIMPLEGKPSTVDVKHLTRPYREINEQTYFTLLNGYLTDHFLVCKDKVAIVCTFGQIRNKYYLMPILREHFENSGLDIDTLILTLKEQGINTIIQWTINYNQDIRCYFGPDNAKILIKENNLLKSNKRGKL